MRDREDNGILRWQDMAEGKEMIPFGMDGGAALVVFWSTEKKFGEGGAFMI